MKNSLKNKLMQMFILGYEGTDHNDDKNFSLALKNTPCGLIFFSKNFTGVKNLKKTIEDISSDAEIPLFFSIDQEGGLVERTISLDFKNNYLTPKAASRLTEQEIGQHYDILCKELKYLGFNMNFAPCADVDTNEQSPIIGSRAFASDTVTVCKNTKIVIDTMKKNNIISVAKHFPGHGNCGVDSHKTMPTVFGDFHSFCKTHILPFKKCIDSGVDCVMVGHINCKFDNKFEHSDLPSTLSKDIIGFLKNDLNFNGLIISDDMVMGGVSKYFSLQESILMGIKAGIEIFIFKDTSEELLNAINNISEIAAEDEILRNIIEQNYDKIIKFKSQNLKENNSCTKFDYEATQKIIDNLAEKTIKIYNKEKFANFNIHKKFYVLRFNPSDIYNLSFDNYSFKEYLGTLIQDEILYSVNPNEDEINRILAMLDKDIPLIIVTYNLHQNKGQISLLNKILNEKIIISSGNEYELTCLKNKDIILSTLSPKPTSLMSSAKLIIENITKISD